ncbi:hypothetical protein GCM10028805_43090 [Spirosoma harenae]
MRPNFYLLLTVVALFAINNQGKGQTLDTPTGSPLTIDANINLPVGYSLQYGSQNYLKGPAANSNSTFLGLGAGNNGAGNSNTFMGYQAGFNNTASSNTFLGYQAGFTTSTGQANVFVGSQAGRNNTTGQGNLFMGQQAGANNIGGSYNMFLGNSAGGNNTSGEGNTAIGDGAFFNGSSGTNNTSVGRYAGYNMTTGTNNTFIGVGASAPNGNGNLTNSTAIGYNASVTASNAMILGNTSVNVGIGNTAPNNKLEITKGSANQSGLRFTNLTSSSPASVGSVTKFLTVNSSGDVVLGQTAGLRVAADGADGLWQSDGVNLQNSNEGGVVIGKGVTKTPAGYKLYVADGILTEKVKVAVKTADDWSDRVFENGYHLRSLGEVEQFINREKHLPGVPSAADVVKEGVDVGKMQAKLLEKVEELTLYNIQLEKVNIEQYRKLHVLEQSQQQQQTKIDELEQLVKKLLKQK